MSDNQKVLAAIKTVEDKLNKIETVVFSMYKLLEETSISREAEQLVGVSAPKKTKTADIVTFIKTKYSSDLNFFGGDVSKDQIEEIEKKITEKAGKKTLSEDELNKKVAHAVWKDILKSNTDLAKKYQELKKREIESIDTPEEKKTVKKATKKVKPPVDDESDQELLDE